MAPRKRQDTTRSSGPRPIGELALIELIRQRAESSRHGGSARGASAKGASSKRARTGVRLGIGDDCAILRPPAGHEIVVTTDLSLEGRHFRRDTHTPQSIGHRALARGLSDLAAMGARPLAAFLSLAMPRSLAADRRFIRGLLDGLMELAEAHGVPLAGGDTSEAPSDHLLLDIVLLGSVPAGRALRRAAARPGDAIYVTGALGGAAVELERALAGDPALQRAKAGLCGQTSRGALRPLNAHPHLFPEPRLAVGEALVRRGLAHAAIDLSDGLSTDLTHLCEASDVYAELDLAALPAHALTAQLDELAQINAVLHGGEDYELLFTASPTAKVPRSIAGVPITRIGRIVAPPKSIIQAKARQSQSKPAKAQGEPTKAQRSQTTKRQPAPRILLRTAQETFGLEPRGWEHLR